MFSKSNTSKIFFDTVNFIKDNYQHFADIFRFDSRQFRNDIAFSIAKHIMNGFETEFVYTLPPVLSVFDKDMLVDVKGQSLIHLIDKPIDCGNFWSAATTGLDVHVMNKQSIIRHKDAFLRML
jgi:hypothetical protein